MACFLYLSGQEIKFYAASIPLLLSMGLSTSSYAQFGFMRVGIMLDQ
jgi:hypothetical protein